MRIRVGTAVAIGIAVLVAVSLAKAVWGPSGSVTTVVQDQTLVEKVKALQEELKQKDVALSVQEKRLQELEEQPTLAAGEQPPTLDGGASGTLEPGAPKKSEGPLVALHESQSTSIGSSGTARKPTPPTDMEPERAGQRPEPSSAEPSGPIINFNAQGVTAVAEAPNKGTLSFQLIKDQKDIRFSGYLFVFVEMGEGQDSRIYAYPQRAQLGDGYLPSDYREGESVTFKINSRVELPYKDVRSGAALSRVSILLYGQDGNIVFQRGFDRKEVKTLSAKRQAL